LIEEDLSIGLTFGQQVRGEASVPDALIAQEQMRIFIETKRGGALDADQIRRHLSTICRHASGAMGGKGSILLGLTKEPIAESDRKVLAADAAILGVKFAAVTFSQIVEALKVECAEFEVDLRSIVDDYAAYLSEEGLLEEGNRWLVVFPCGISLTENERFGLYYEPPSRPCKHNYRFIGIYAQKNIPFVGAVEAIAIATMVDESISYHVESGELTEAHKQRIASVIDQTAYYDLKSAPHRYYLVDSFIPTGARKTSPGGIMGLRYLDLEKIVPNYNYRKDYTSFELAKALNGVTWE